MTKEQEVAVENGADVLDSAEVRAKKIDELVAKLETGDTRDQLRRGTLHVLPFHQPTLSPAALKLADKAIKSAVVQVNCPVDANWKIDYSPDAAVDPRELVDGNYTSTFARVSVHHVYFQKLVPPGASGSLKWERIVCATLSKLADEGILAYGLLLKPSWVELVQGDAAIFVGFPNPAWLAAQHANGQPYDSACPLADPLNINERIQRELADECRQYPEGTEGVAAVLNTIPTPYQDGMAGAARICAHNHINAYLGNKCFGWRDGQMTADADWTNLPGY